VTDGVVVIDKPAGVTSHDIVDDVRRRLGTRKVGHAGTLDPDATGVLVLGLGRATRFLDYVHAAPKSYVAGARFGITTSTQDASGEIVARKPADIGAADLEAALEGFVGTIDQVPPMVSAIKVAGERLYARARRGETVVRAARRVTIYRLHLRSFASGDPPEATLEVECSKGTYVRTLVHDIGVVLGCGAHLSSLRRTATAGFTETDAISPASLTPERIRPLIDVVAHLPHIELGAAEAGLVRDGRPIESDVGLPPGTSVALVHAGRLVAVYRSRGRQLVAERVVGR
jgi:tRNA pseudouridine55 synthase